MLQIFADRPDEKSIEFCRRFLDGKSGERFVLGRNEYAAKLASLVEVDGFIDDYTDERTFLGKPVVKMPETPKSAMVISAVVLGRLVTALNNLRAHGLECLDYFNFLKYSELAHDSFLAESKADILANIDKYHWVHGLLKDAESRDVFCKLINFRVSSDLRHMQDFRIDYDRQYFEDFLPFRPGEVFVDAGGFDGQTVINFIGLCPQYKAVHFFEPDPGNLRLARQRLASHRDVHYYPSGLGAGAERLKFSAGDGSASKISETGDIEIQIDALDRLVAQPVSMVKMDIEGAEIPALQGARQHIRADHPALAICCYHKPDDFWRIPEEVFRTRDDFSVYLRHYSEGTTETVMYFVPED